LKARSYALFGGFEKDENFSKKSLHWDYLWVIIFLLCFEESFQSGKG